MVKTFKPDFYIGTITGLSDLGTKEHHVIIAAIPGIVEDITAFPYGSNLDEPKIGDPVLICNLDPIYNSFYVYQKLKENDFIGFRSSGKMVDITPESITIGIFDKDKEYSDGERPECSSKIVIDKDNNVTLEGDNLNITVKSDCIISGSNITVKGDVNITDGDLTVNGTASPSGFGPFCAIPICPYTGSTHVGNVSKGN